jgi:hypothetical protein
VKAAPCSKLSNDEEYDSSAPLFCISGALYEFAMFDSCSKDEETFAGSSSYEVGSLIFIVIHEAVVVESEDNSRLDSTLVDPSFAGKSFFVVPLFSTFGYFKDVKELMLVLLPVIRVTISLNDSRLPPLLFFTPLLPPILSTDSSV